MMNFLYMITNHSTEMLYSDQITQLRDNCLFLYDWYGIRKLDQKNYYNEAK